MLVPQRSTTGVTYGQPLGCKRNGGVRQELGRKIAEKTLARAFVTRTN